MIYFDNAATTFVDEEVLNTFVLTTKKFKGNPNALHQLGYDAKCLMEESTKQVAQLLECKKEEVIFTSSASESNNLAVQGLLKSYPHRKKRILTTPLEHASLKVLLDNLALEGVEVVYLKLDDKGHVLLSDLEEKLQEETLLVSIQHVNSEVGVIQDIQKIGEIVHKYPKTFFHVDATQSIGKLHISLENIDLLSCSAHKFFGLKGIACLIKKEKVMLKPLIYGGKSQTIYRAGTPSVPLIASFAKALRLALNDMDTNKEHVRKLKNYLESNLEKMDNVVVNTYEDGSPYIVNFSVLSVKSETLLHALSEKEVYISTKTACSKGKISDVLTALNKDEKVASSSLRVSFSKENTLDEVKEFLKILKEEINRLNFQERSRINEESYSH